MKIRRIFWGLLFLAAGILIVVHQLGYPVGGYFGTISVWGIVLSVLMIPIIVEGIAHLNFFGIIIPVGILAIIHSELLGIDKLGARYIILASVCLSIGFTIIFRRPVETFKKKYFPNPDNPKAGGYWFDKNHTVFNESFENVEDSEVNCAVHFGEATKYVKSALISTVNISCSFGSAKLFFDGADLNPEGAEVRINASFAGVEIYIPKSWRVQNDILPVLGGVSEKNHPVLTPESPLLQLKGKVSFGGVEIIYI